MAPQCSEDVMRIPGYGPGRREEGAQHEGETPAQPLGSLRLVCGEPRVPGERVGRPLSPPGKVLRTESPWGVRREDPAEG